MPRSQVVRVSVDIKDHFNLGHHVCKGKERWTWKNKEINAWKGWDLKNALIKPLTARNMNWIELVISRLPSLCVAAVSMVLVRGIEPMLTGVVLPVRSVVPPVSGAAGVTMQEANRMNAKDQEPMLGVWP